MKKKLLAGVAAVVAAIVAIIGYQINETNKEEKEVKTFYNHALDEYYPILEDINNYYGRAMNEDNLGDWVIDGIKERSDLKARLKSAVEETINTDLKYPASLAAKKNLLNIMMEYEELLGLNSELGREAEQDFLLYSDNIQDLLDERKDILGKYYDFSSSTESASE